jgi:hypothetical protein
VSGATDVSLVAKLRGKFLALLQGTGRERGGGLGSWKFFGYHAEVRQVGHAERCGYGHVGSVAACGHEHPSDARLIVAGVEGPPAVFEINFEPGAEVHDAGDGHADVA